MIEKYLESKKFAWAPTTLKSERHRLNAVGAHLNGDPETLWNNIEHMKPYSRLTTWTRVTQYWQFLIDSGLQTGPNHYEKWRFTNARLFKNCYTKTKPEISFEEAKKLISSIQDDNVRERANFILNNGLRISEHLGSGPNGNIIGKGNKARSIYGTVKDPGVNVVNDQRLRRSLRAIGLKPHDLRKLFLSRIVELGANTFELCEIAGWSSIATASSYIKVDTNRLKSLVDKVNK